MTSKSIVFLLAALVIISLTGFYAYATEPAATINNAKDNSNIDIATKTNESTTTAANPGQDAAPDITKQGVQVADIYVACKHYFSKILNTRENVSRKNICNGFFFGSASMLLLLQDERIATKTCMPMDVSTEEIIRAFLDWAEKEQAQVTKTNMGNDDPAKSSNKKANKMSMLASEALLKLIRDQYPCNEFKKK